MRLSFFSSKRSQGQDKIIRLTGDVQDCAYKLLDEFNKKKVDLLDLPPHKRITLFFLTRALKTFSAIAILYQHGYTQDVSALIRSLLENLISIKYILRDPQISDKKTARFVDYKWVILRRYLSNAESKTDEENVSKQVVNFRKNYSILSDKSLITWSGKSIRDMAKSVDLKLLEEYDSTFRLCSRFSHPSIIGDKDFFTFENMTMTFSSAPSTNGDTTLIAKSILYLLDFLRITCSLFKLSQATDLDEMRVKSETIFSENVSQETTGAKKTSKVVRKDAEKKIIVQFDIVSRPR